MYKAAKLIVVNRNIRNTAHQETMQSQEYSCINDFMTIRQNF